MTTAATVEDDEHRRVCLGIGQFIIDSVRKINDQLTIHSNWIGNCSKPGLMIEIEFIGTLKAYGSTGMTIEVMVSGQPTIEICSTVWNIYESILLSDPQLFDKIDSIVSRTIGSDALD